MKSINVLTSFSTVCSSPSALQSSAKAAEAAICLLLDVVWQTRLRRGQQSQPLRLSVHTHAGCFPRVSWSRHQSSVHLLEHRNINIQFHSIVTYLSLHIIYIFQSCCFIVFTMTLDYHYSQTSITVYLHRNIKSQHQRFQLQSTRAQR